MKTDKVTREDLRALHHGETRTFELPNFAAVQSAKSSAYILGHIEGCRFACITARRDSIPEGRRPGAWA